MPDIVLLIEDDLSLHMTIGDRLRAEGYAVLTAADGLTGLELATSSPCHVILLDLMLPGLGGYEVCRRLRQRGSTVPILMLTARGQTADKVAGLKLGADDYLTKPFDLLELVARIEALLRRSRTPPARAAAIQLGPLRIDLRAAEVTRHGRPVPLLAKEFELLRYFLDHPGETLSREELLREVWGYDFPPLSRTVDVHVLGLRQKLEEDPHHPILFLTVRGLGYKLAAPAE